MLHSDGTAVVTKHNTIKQLCLFVKYQCASLFPRSVGKVFEVTHISLESQFNRTEHLNALPVYEFGGFLEISDGEIAYKMFIVQEIIDNAQSELM